MARVLLIATLDTKGEEADFVRGRIRAAGHEVLVVDAGVMRDPPFEPDVGADEIAGRGGSTLNQLRSAGDRGHAVEVMLAGLESLVRELYQEIGRAHV